MDTNHADGCGLWICGYDYRRIINEVVHMTNWEEHTGHADDLTTAELFALIRDAVIQGTLDANTMQNTGRANQVRANLEKAKNLPSIRQING